MQFIRVRQPDAADVFHRTENEARQYVKNLIQRMGIEAARNELTVEIVDVPTNKDALFDLLNGTQVEYLPLGEYYITPRGALKRDRDE